MPEDVWLGDSWRIEVTATEPLEKASLELEPIRQLTAKGLVQPWIESHSPQSLKGATVVFEGAIKNIEEDNLRARLVMRDLAGWINEIELGHWRFPKVLSLRSKPVDNLTFQEVKNMLKERNFFDSKWNQEGKDIHNNYVQIENKGVKLIKDTATGLTWQQSGSSNTMTFSAAQTYIDDLNRQSFAGYSDWRLPTLEEAMTLLEPQRRGGIYIDAIFDQTKSWIWTSDKDSASSVWGVLFYDGYFDVSDVDHLSYVRAVR